VPCCAANAAAAAAVETTMHAAQAMAVVVATMRVEMEQESAARSQSPVGRSPQSPSPERRRGCHGRSPVAQPVVQTIYCDSGAGIPWVMLTKLNYNEWSLLMKIKLQARHLVR